MRIATHYDGKGRRIAEHGRRPVRRARGRRRRDHARRPQRAPLRPDPRRRRIPLRRLHHRHRRGRDGDVRAVGAAHASTWSSGPTGCTPTCAGWSSARSRVRPRPGLLHLDLSPPPTTSGLDREEAVHAAPGRTANVYSTKQDSQAKALFIFVAAAAYDRRDWPSRRSSWPQAFAGVEWEVPGCWRRAGVDGLLLRLRQPDPHGPLVQGPGRAGRRRRLLRLAGVGPGTSLALVGAYVLAGELASGGGVDGYEREMRAYVDANQQLGPANVKGMVLPSRADLVPDPDAQAAPPPARPRPDDRPHHRADGPRRHGHHTEELCGIKHSVLV